MPETTKQSPSNEAPADKAMALQAVAQLAMIGDMFPHAPERVKKSAKEFAEAIREWAGV